MMFFIRESIDNNNNKYVSEDTQKYCIRDESELETRNL